MVRARRRALGIADRHHAADAVAAVLRRLPLWRRARRVGVYMPADGELDVLRAVTGAHRTTRRVYLPVVPRHAGRLAFRPWETHTPLRPNRFGIPEPAAGTAVPATRLDVVLTPLVAFDARGNRLGMGGGFYDRTFAGQARGRRWRRPRLIGVAYDFQRVDRLDARAWDVPLDAVITERGLLRFINGEDR